MIKNFYKTQAYVLYVRKYRESSVFVDILTREYGRVHCIAKGVRRKKSHLSALNCYFCHLELQYMGTKEPYSIIQADYKQRSFAGLTPSKSIYGFYANELVLKLLSKEDEHPEIFDLYQRLVIELSIPSNNEDIMLRYFERDLVSALGYEILSNQDMNENPISSDLNYIYNIGCGWQVITVNTATENCVSGKTIINFFQNKLSNKKERRQIKQIMRNIVHHLLGSELKSRQVLFDMQASKQ